MAGESILIVEDNPLNLKLVRAVLQHRGYDVKTAVNATSALLALETFHPQLILMDLQLPGISGLDLTRVLKANAATRDIVIVALTAAAMKGDDVRARAAGCDGYLPKPIDVTTFPATIAGFLDGRR